MDSPLDFWIGLIFMIAAPLGFWFYTRLGMRLHREGGEVRSEGLGVPDLVASIILASTLAMMAILAFAESEIPKPMDPDQIVPGIIFLLAMAGCVATFMLVRRVRLTGVVRPAPLSAPRAIGRGALMLLCALPVVGAFSLITQLLLPQEMLEEQELVTLFGDVSKEGNLQTILLIVLAAVVVAPLCEEFVFRGYFYPVWKRYFGPVGSAVLASTLFALMHANVASLPGLFGLAICLTLAFEASGSILVPMAMHAFFNGLSLVMLYLRAQGVL